MGIYIDSKGNITQTATPGITGYAAGPSNPPVASTPAPTPQPTPAPSYNPPPSQNVIPATINPSGIVGSSAPKTQTQATLTSPDGKYKTVVNVGSAEASSLQGAGWKLGATGKSVLALADAIKTLPKIDNLTPPQKITDLPQNVQDAIKNIPAKDTSTFTDQQKQELEIAQARIAAGKGSVTDQQNIDYAKSKGWAPAETASATNPNPQVGVKDTSTFTDLQKQQLEAAQARIAAGKGTPTDVQNVNYAKSKGWVPSGLVEEPGTGLIQEQPKVDATKPSADALAAIPDADKKWVNDAYQKYFDRAATSAEILNWTKENPQALEQFLAKEQKTYGYVSLEQKQLQDKNLKDALAIIDSSDLPPEIKSLWKQTVQAYPNAKDFNPQQIIDTFKQIQGGTIDPYYKELANVAINDLKTNINQLSLQRQSELEAERANAGETIRQAQAGQEKAGMTFTGKGIEALGASSAYAQQPSAAVATPVQIPFGGVKDTFYEGNVNQANRLVASSSAAKYAANQQALGSQAEKMLGSKAVMSAVPGLTYAPSGVTDIAATNVQEQKGKEAQTLQGLINNWAESQKVYKNTTV